MSSAIAADLSSSDMNLDMPGLAKPIPRFSTARLRRIAAASSCAKALTACLLKLTTAAVPNAMPNVLASFLTFFSRLLVDLPALSKAFLPVNSAAISITTDGLAIILPSMCN